VRVRGPLSLRAEAASRRRGRQRSNLIPLCRSRREEAEGERCSSLWIHDPLAELSKVFVKGKCGRDAQPLHESEACAIHETESLVAVSLEKEPGLQLIARRYRDDRRKIFMQQTPAKRHRRRVPQSHSDKCHGLMDDKVARHQ